MNTCQPPVKALASLRPRQSITVRAAILSPLASVSPVPSSAAIGALQRIAPSASSRRSPAAKSAEASER